MLKVIQSNRTEVLADALAATLAERRRSPLEQEVVLVPSSALGRWLGFALAERRGIVANIRFGFLASYVWELFGAVLPDVPRQSPFEPQMLAWRLMHLLGASTETRGARARPPEFERVGRYLSRDEPRRRFDLARALAAAFERYLVYRPDWIDAWAQGRLLALGPDEGWQAALWRDTVATLPAAAQEHPRERFFAALAGDESARARLPAAIDLFGVSSLPPLYFEILERLAEHCEVCLYVLNPGGETYWGDIVQRRRALAATLDESPEARYLEVGNRLLASWGRAAQSFFDALAGAPSVERFDDPGTGTVLATLQSDVLNLRERGTGAAPKLPIAAADDSLRVHVCHSAMREVEVLHNCLLDLFERDAALAPGDILVLVPQLEDYAPCIEAVFAQAPLERRIPFSIADRNPAAGSAVAQAFRRLLDLPRTRLDAESVLALLEAPAVGRRFGIERDDLPALRRWLRETGVRWGRDEESRTALGLPATPAHTWRAGFDRLLLGYAAAGRERELFAGILPYDDVEGDTAGLLGRLKTFADAVFAAERDLRRSRTAAQWRDRLDRLLADFFEPDEDEAHDMQSLRAALAAVASSADAGDCTEVIPLDVFERALADEEQRGARGTGFLGGGVAFAAMRPGRAVPARVIALLGMNDGAFPREQRTHGFDLAARNPRRGDRVPREEDRYAFLEAMLAARSRLHISYIGRSVRDNEALPPSPLVSDLLEAARRGFVVEGAEDAPGRIVTEHPLQPFSRRYFDGSDARLFSYAAEYVAPRVPLPIRPFLSAPLPFPDEDRVMTLDRLADILRHPARHLLRRRLGLVLEEAEGELETTEPFALDALERHDLRGRLFTLLAEGMSAEEAAAIVRARGGLPEGAAGEALIENCIGEVAPLAEEARSVRGSGQAIRIEFDREIGGVRLVGVVAAHSGEGQIGWHPGNLNASRRIAAWVRHLAFQLVAPEGMSRRSVLRGLDDTLALAPHDNAEADLVTLVGIALKADRERVPFFPKSALTYAERVPENSTDKALDAARVAWRGNRWQAVPGESEDPYFKLAFRDVEDPLDEEFQRLAQTVFEPMLRCALEDQGEKS